MAILPDLGRGLFLMCVGSGACNNDSPTEAEPPSSPQVVAMEPADEQFQFGPTVAKFRPPNTTLIPIAEVADATSGRLDILVISPLPQTGTPAVHAWTFASTGDKETVEPEGSPTPLVATRAGDPDDPQALRALHRRLSAGHTVTSRPQGIEASSPATALMKMHEDVQLFADENGLARGRAEAFARFTRGLDHDLFFTRGGLSRAIASLKEEAPTTSDDTGNTRRASVSWGSDTLSMLRTSGGWVVTAIERRN